MFEKKSLFLIISGVTVLILGFWIGVMQDVKASTSVGNQIRIQLDIGDSEVWEGYPSEGTAVWGFNITADAYLGKECALLLTEEDSFGACDDDAVVWVSDGSIIGVGSNSLFTDIGAGGFTQCCDNGTTACEKNNVVCLTQPLGGKNCNWDNDEPGDNAKAVFEQSQIGGWVDNCPAGKCTIYPPAAGGVRSYEILNEYLCETTWRICDDAVAVCETYNGRKYACDASGSGWTPCAGATPDCVAGACVPATTDLVLTASADPSAIEVNGTSTITFLVTKGGAPVNGATVENITATGGFVDATSCITNVSGECVITYTAPPIAGIYGVNAEKATKAGETDSGPAGVVITVSSLPIAPCGPEIGVLCNPVNNASDFYDVIFIAIRYLLSLIALITLLFIIISGIKYLTSFGNEEKMRSAKEGLFSAVFGLALVLMAYAILEVIIKVLSS